MSMQPLLASTIRGRLIIFLEIVKPGLADVLDDQRVEIMHWFLETVPA